MADENSIPRRAFVAWTDTIDGPSGSAEAVRVGENDVEYIRSDLAAAPETARQLAHITDLITPELRANCEELSRLNPLGQPRTDAEIIGVALSLLVEFFAPKTEFLPGSRLSREHHPVRWSPLVDVVAPDGTRSRVPAASLADAAAKTARQRDLLLEALKRFVGMYTAMVNSGDCGFWDPETEDEVIEARAAIAECEGGGQ